MAAEKSITDPLYGSINLTKTEADLVSSRSFQRLHNVRQLGLAHLVFPSAGYSRFAHSVGALHNASRLIDAISKNDKPIDGDRKSAYRIAALLHDVGHYPFSHATEHTLENYYAGSLFKDSNMARRDGNADSINHEDVGATILSLNSDIRSILEKSEEVSLETVQSIFSSQSPDPLFGIITSDLDCDRLDYLARTSHLGGVPYGNVDVDFIISKATTGPQGQLAFENKAAKAIDHLLISRYYDYMQMVHHKTVEALEWSLAESIRFVLDHSPGLLSRADVEARINDGSWWRVDDSWLVAKLKEHEDRTQHSAGLGVMRDHLSAVLYRRPAKRVWKWEVVRDREDCEVGTKLQLTSKVVAQISQEMGIDESRFWINDRSFRFVKLSHLETTNTDFEEERAKSVLLRSRGGEQYMVERGDLLLKTLAQMRNFAVNVYYLPTPDEPKSVRNDIRTKLANEMGE